MATSGSSSWNRITSKIINDTLQYMGVINHNQMATPEQLESARGALNRMIKGFQKRRIFLWTEEMESYQIQSSSSVTGSDGNIYTCVFPHTSTSNNKPITGSLWKDYWVLYGDSGDEWETTTSYTSSGVISVSDDCISIEGAWYRDDSCIDNPLTILSGDQWRSLERKVVNFGEPKYIYLNKGSISSKSIFLYPIPYTNEEGNLIKILKLRKLEDFVGDEDDPDFPGEWMDAIISNLAKRLARMYHLDPASFDRHAQEALYEATAGEIDDTDGEFIKPLWRV